MNKIKPSMFLKRFFLLGKDSPKDDTDKILVVNITLFILFFLHLFLLIAYIKTSEIFIISCLRLFVLFCLCIIYFTKHKKTKYFYFFLLLILEVSFLSSHSGGMFLEDLYYFPLIIFVPVFFDLKEDIFYSITIFFLMLLGFVGNQLTDYYFHRFNRLDISPEGIIFLKTVTIIQVLVLFLIGFYFFYKKMNLLKQKIRDEKILELSILEKTYSNKDFVSEDMLKELHHLALENNLIFAEKFKLYYPHFIRKLNLENTLLTPSEQWVCFLLRLNFTTKQIAVVTNSTVKAIEGKKYRIRKKIKIPLDQSTSNWINTL